MSTPAHTLQGDNVLQFSFVVNKSFLGSNSHPITVPRTQVEYAVIAASHAGNKPLKIVCPNAQTLQGHLYEGVAGYGPYYQIRMDGFVSDPLYDLRLGDRVLVDLDVSAHTARIRHHSADGA